MVSKQYEKGISGVLEVIRIKEIANASDEFMVIFEKTPIHEVLLQRREYAIKLTSSIHISEDSMRMLEFYDNKIREFFLI